MSTSLFISNARVIDVETGAVSEVNIDIGDGIIRGLDTSSHPAEGQRVIDAAGQFVLPGLIDAHVHTSAVVADLGRVRHLPPSYVALGAANVLSGMRTRGFTTVRDTGGADFGLSQAQQDGLVDGPRVIYGGKALSQTGGHGDRRQRGVSEYDSHPHCAGTSVIVDGVEPLRLAAREELRRGASHLKMHVSGGVSSPTDSVDEVQYSWDEIRAVVEEADHAGAYVTVHAYPSKAIVRAVEAGARCVEHGNLADDVAFDAMLAADAFLVPTIVTYWAMREFGLDQGVPLASWNKIPQVLDAATRTLEAATRRGVKIAFGTDLLGPMHRYQNEEFRIRAEVQTPLQLIQSATMNAAQLIRRADLGVVREESIADLILLDSNPLENISVLADPERHLRTVIQGGLIVRQAA